MAAWIQSATALVLVALFALLALDPVLTQFSLFSGLAVAALLVLYIMCSLVVAGFRRERAEGPLWQTLIAPALAALLLAWVLYLVVSNFTALIGGSAERATALLVAVSVMSAAGFLVESRTERRQTVLTSHIS